VSGERWIDPVVEEVRRVREDYTARFGFDLERIVDDLRQLEASGEFEMAELPTRGSHRHLIPAESRDVDDDG